MKKTIRQNEKGITLIALVITIIVLLILAGVSISMLTGENGILNQAAKAKDMTDDAQVRENIIMAYNNAVAKKYTEGSTDFINDMIEELEKTYGDGNVSITESDGTYTVTINGKEYTFDGETQTGGTGGGDTTESKLTEEEKTALENNGIAELIDEEITNNNLKDNDNIKAVITGEVPIPTDGTYVEGTKDTGVVVKMKDNSEFVWVPVASVDTMATVTSGTDNNGRTNYQGKLYDFSGTTSEEMTSYGQGTTSYREPDVVSHDGGTYDTVGITADLLQEEYNAMVESVSKYGGFFVGRYESSISGNTVASISGVTPMSASTSSGNRWYGMYKLEKEYSSSNNLTSVQSSMIWGSQYDAMLNWALTGADIAKVTATGNGNHSGSVVNTGATSTDVINNIYDLEGNMYEWTLEAHTAILRVTRGGNYSYSDSPSIRYSRRPNDTDSRYSSRLTLYIK